MPKMLVSQGNHRPVDQEAKEGADIDGIDFARCQPADAGKQKRNAEVDQLGPDYLILAIHEAEDVGRVVIRVHDQICSLVKGNGAAQGHDSQKPGYQPPRQRQVRQAKGGKEAGEQVDEVAEAGDKDDFAQETGQVKAPHKQLVDDGYQKAGQKHGQGNAGMENMGQVDLRCPPGSRADIAGNGDPVAKSIQDQAKGQGRQPAGKGVKARPGFRFEERQKNMK